jgi:hypothetical protein
MPPKGRRGGHDPGVESDHADLEPLADVERPVEVNRLAMSASRMTISPNRSRIRPQRSSAVLWVIAQLQHARLWWTHRIVDDPP